MLDDEPTGAMGAGTSDDTTTSAGRPRRRRAASRPAGPPQGDATATDATHATVASGAAVADQPTTATEAEPRGEGETPAATARKRAPRKRATSAVTDPFTAPVPASEAPVASEAPAAGEGPSEPAAEAPAPASRRRRATKKATAPEPTPVVEDETDESDETDETGTPAAAPAGPPVVLFQPPAEEPVRRSRRRATSAAAAEDAADATGSTGTTGAASTTAPTTAAVDDEADDGDDESDETGEGGARRRRRRRGGRGRRRTGEPGEGSESVAGSTDAATDAPDQATSPAAGDGAAAAGDDDSAGDDEDEGTSGSARRRRRRRRRSGSGPEDQPTGDDPPNTVVRVREPRARTREPREDRDEVTSIKGSTRLEAKKQRRREGRDQGRRRPPVLTEAEFLARREAVERVMLIRQSGERTQIAVLEDGVLVEHYVNRASASSSVGNVYLGRVQNVLPSMEAAFVDIGKGRNAVLYAGEVNWDAAGLEGQPKRIESALKSGDSVLVQVTKDPIGSKGSRLTSQISLPGRYLVLVPDGSMTGISRKLPDTERTRLKAILRTIVPEDAGVIVRTAAEGASEDELTRDVERLTAQWSDIAKKAKTATAPALLYGEPDLTVRVVRDIFNEDFVRVVVSGDDAWDTVEGYVRHVAPDLVTRLEHWTGEGDIFAAHRVDESLVKALDRKVYLPSGGSLVIDRTEAMVVVDVNTGKFTGKGGNLEETVTKNNLEAAEEIVRQLRLRDLGGIIVIDFIDMVLESNRELVIRRLTECLGRDRTKHQVAEMTSLGLVQMTRKRVGQGLFEAFSTTCESCNGRGVHVHLEPVESRAEPDRGRGPGGPGRPPKPSSLASGRPSPRADGPAEEAAHASAEPPVDAAEAHDAPASSEAPAAGPDAGADKPADAPAEKPKRRSRARKATAPAGPPPSADAN